MAERCIKGDFIGFTFGGVHSSELGLMRVSNGSRYDMDLLPPLQDKTAQVNGRDGAVYFGSQYNTRPIKVSVAFDNMTEEGFNRLKQLLQDKKPKYLWFDETPYKQWLVKAANVQGFKWVCFDESHNGKEKRVYKGEGTLEFSCFSPYAESRVRFIDDTIEQVYVWNREETPRKLIPKNKDGTGYVLKKHIWDTNTILKRQNGGYLDDEGNFYSDWNLSSTALSQISNGVIGIVETFDSYYVGLPKNNDLIEKQAYKQNVYVINNINDLKYGDQGFIAINLKTLQHERIYYKDVGYKNTRGQRLNPYFFAPSTNTTKETECYSLFLNSDEKLFWIKPIVSIDNEIETFDYIITDLTSFLFLQDGVCLLDYYNISEWKKTSGLMQIYSPTEFVSYDEWTDIDNYQVAVVYNGGDLDSNFTLTWYASQDKKFPGEELYLISQNEWWNFLDKSNKNFLKIKSFDLKDGDFGVIIDTKLKMIKGIDNKGKTTGNVYNKFIKEGDFFKLPSDKNLIGENAIDYEEEDLKIVESYLLSYGRLNYSIEYKHYYI